MTKELKRFEKWWDAEDDIPNDGPYTPDTPIQFAWAGWHAALAQTEQEPVAYTNGTDVILAKYWTADYPPEGWEPLGYTTPPQRTWIGLTDEEMEATFLECGGKWNGDFWKIEDADFHPFLRTIEAILKE